MLWFEKEHLMDNIKSTICQETQIRSIMIVKCGHSFCFSCILNHCFYKIQDITKYVDYLYYSLQIYCPECKTSFDLRIHLIHIYNLKRIIQYIINSFG